MVIKSTGKLDQQSITALAWFGMFKKYEPKKAIVLIAAIEIIPITYTMVRLLMLTRGDKLSDPMQLIWAIVPLLITSMFLYIPIIAPSIKAQKLKYFQNASCEYTFYDSSFTAVISGIAGTKNYSIRYSELTQVGESSKNFFIFRGNDSFIVDKSTLENGTAEHLRHRFSTFENIKYTLCNY